MSGLGTIHLLESGVVATEMLELSATGFASPDITFHQIIPSVFFSALLRRVDIAVARTVLSLQLGKV